MVTSKWKGDDQYRLPAQQVEPYRLWFEFLQLAAKDQTLTVDTKHYKAWGNFAELKFSLWKALGGLSSPRWSWYDERRLNGGLPQTS